MSAPLSYMRRDVEFSSRGTCCRAWLYTPANKTSRALPCIVMAHGLGGTRGSGLEPFAERFAAAGYLVLLFDYRHFGDSDGAPRQLLTVGRQLDDWRAAVACARRLEGIDPARIALWGTSLSSGHVLTLAAADPQLAAVIAQNPMTDGLAAVLQLVRHAGLGPLLRLAARALADHGRALLGLSPVFVPVVARSGELAPLSGDKAYAGYMALVPRDWRNQMSARMALTLALYRPVLKARQLRCPALIQACMQDQAVCARAAVAYARRAGAELRQYEHMDHFDIYVGEDFERAVGDQLEFLARVLPIRMPVRDAA
jgi:pimeloyl-ACP methyl ester carboxylesterase